MTNPFDHFRTTLVPKGTSDLVRLTMPPVSYFKHEFVRDVIDELERKVQAHAMGLDEITSMDRLVITILQDSSNWTNP